MPEILLGPTGSETILPKGVRIEVSVVISKKISVAEMSDTSERYSFGKPKRRWPLITWKPLPLADIDILIYLHKLNQILHFQNQYESTIWYDVIITAFSYDSIMIAGAEKYIATMEIEEAI